MNKTAKNDLNQCLSYCLKKKKIMLNMIFNKITKRMLIHNDYKVVVSNSDMVIVARFLIQFQDSDSQAVEWQLACLR